MGYLQLKLLSQDDQSITGSWDTLTGVCVVYTHPGTVPGWSEYLWIPGYSDRAGLCGVYGHPSTVPRWSELPEMCPEHTERNGLPRSSVKEISG